MTTTPTKTADRAGAGAPTPLRHHLPRRPRLVVVDQHTAFADLVETGLWQEFVVRSVPLERAASATIVGAVRSTRPAVALVSTRLGPYADGLTVIDGLASRGTVVVALCPDTDERAPAEWGRCLLAGARGVVSFDSPLSELRATLTAALGGRSTLTPARAHELRAAAREAADDERWSARARLDALTRREREIVAHLMLGRCASEIARAQVVAEATVRTQIRSVLTKLDVRSQLAAVAIAHRAGWRMAADELSAAG